MHGARLGRFRDHTTDRNDHAKVLQGRDLIGFLLEETLKIKFTLRFLETAQVPSGN